MRTDTGFFLLTALPARAYLSAWDTIGTQERQVFAGESVNIVRRGADWEKSRSIKKTLSEDFKERKRYFWSSK